MLVNPQPRRFDGAARGSGLRPRAYGLKIGSIEALIRHPPRHRAHHPERVDVRTVGTAHGPFRCAPTATIGHGLHFALLRGELTPRRRRWCACTYRTMLSDALRWRRAVSARRPTKGARRDRAQGRGALVVLGAEPASGAARACTRRAGRRRRSTAAARQPTGGATAPARILAELGLGKLRVIGTRATQVGLSAASASRSWNTSNCRRARLAARRDDPTMPHLRGDLRARDGARFAILASPAGTRASPMRCGRRRARKAFADHGVAEAWSTWCACPAPQELPLAAARLAATRSPWPSSRSAASFAATPAVHEQVADDCADGLMPGAALDHGVPVANGVLMAVGCTGTRKNAGGMPWRKDESRAGGDRDGEPAGAIGMNQRRRPDSVDPVLRGRARRRA